MISEIEVFVIAAICFYALRCLLFFLQRTYVQFAYRSGKAIAFGSKSD